MSGPPKLYAVRQQEQEMAAAEEAQAGIGALSHLEASAGGLQEEQEVAAERAREGLAALNRTEEGDVAKKATKRSGKKQLNIPGTEGPSHPDVDAAAEDFLEHRRKHAASGRKLKEKKQRIVDEMKKAGLSEYRDNEAEPPLFVRIEDDCKVSVKEVKERPAPGDEAEQAAEE